jgi:hypothetical protein
MKFRKRPVVIEAVQWVADNLKEIEAFAGKESVSQLMEDNVFFLKTLEGLMRVTVGSWIVKGVKGEFYAVKPDIFERTYEAATGPENNPYAPVHALIEIVAAAVYKVQHGGLFDRDKMYQEYAGLDGDGPSLKINMNKLAVDEAVGKIVAVTSAQENTIRGALVLLQEYSRNNEIDTLDQQSILSFEEWLRKQTNE